MNIRSGGAIRFGAMASTLALAIPMVLSRLSELLVPTADLIVVGASNSQELGYLGLGWAPWALTFMISTGLISSASVLFSQAAEKADGKIQASIFYSGLLLALLCGFAIIMLASVSGQIFTLLGYDAELAYGAAGAFQGYAWCMPLFLTQVHIAQYYGASRRPWPEVCAVVITVLSNVALNQAVTQWSGEVSAANIALMTSVARSLGAISLIVFLALDRTSRLNGLGRIIFEHKMLSRLCYLGGPLALSFGLESGTYFVMALMAAQLGVIEVAGFQAGMNTLNLIYMVTIGIGMAASVQSGRALGAANIRRVRAETVVACSIGAAAMLIVSALMLFFPYKVARIYSDDPAVLTVVASGMLICSTYLIFEAMQVILKMSLRGLGDVWVPLCNMLFAFWIVGIPASWVLTFVLGWSTDGLFIGIGVAMFLAFVLNAMRFRNLTSTQLTALI